MTHQLGAMPAGRAMAAIATARIPFAYRLDRHDDPTPPPAPTPPAPAPPADPAPSPDEPVADDPKLGPAGEKALAAMKERARIAEAAQKAAEAKTQAFEDRDKTELEKATAAAERATAEATEAKAELVRQRVINETGLSADLAEFLPTGDEDTVRAAADKLKGALGTPAKAGPRPDPSQGSGRPAPGPTDFRTASKAELKAETDKLGIRLRR